jgi:hypothetical protein
MKRFNVVVSKDDGGVELHPMKEWLRQHPEHVPAGLDATSSTSHQLRDGLRRRGWSVEETPTEVRLLPQGVAPSALGAVLGESDDEGQDASEQAFVLEFEYQLRDFLARNMAVIDVDGRKLRVYVDPTGRDGIEYPTAVGPIDIVAIDSNGDFYVFELKRGRSPDHAIGQLARYMGWVKETIGKDRKINGVIVAKEIGPNLRYAVSVMPNVTLFEYEIEFHLKPIGTRSA